MRRQQIAFFDVDHTISRRATALAFVFVCIRRGYIKPWYLLGAPLLFIAYRLFSVNMEFLYSWSLPVLRGKTRKEMEDVSVEAFNRYIKDRLYPGALREIDKHKENGIRTILATSTPFEAVYPLAQFCGISANDIIATQFAYDGDIFTGKLAGRPVFSSLKSGIIREYVERSGTEIKNCSFYTDSIHDLSLLEVIGHPVAANPDARLRRVALKKGWTIKDFRK